ncbi:hypothetical protein HN446_04860, partial [bacterium]|nr:hypothetical protein [bacterium]
YDPSLLALSVTWPSYDTNSEIAQWQREIAAQKELTAQLTTWNKIQQKIGSATTPTNYLTMWSTFALYCLGQNPQAGSLGSALFNMSNAADRYAINQLKETKASKTATTTSGQQTLMNAIDHYDNSILAVYFVWDIIVPTIASGQYSISFANTVDAQLSAWASNINGPLKAVPTSDYAAYDAIWEPFAEHCIDNKAPKATFRNTLFNLEVPYEANKLFQIKTAQATDPLRQKIEAYDPSLLAASIIWPAYAQDSEIAQWQREIAAYDDLSSQLSIWNKIQQKVSTTTTPSVYLTMWNTFVSHCLGKNPQSGSLDTSLFNMSNAMDKYAINKLRQTKASKVSTATPTQQAQITSINGYNSSILAVYFVWDTIVPTLASGQYAISFAPTLKGQVDAWAGDINDVLYHSHSTTYDPVWDEFTKHCISQNASSSDLNRSVFDEQVDYNSDRLEALKIQKQQQMDEQGSLTAGSIVDLINRHYPSFIKTSIDWQNIVDSIKQYQYEIGAYMQLTRQLSVWGVDINHVINQATTSEYSTYDRAWGEFIQYCISHYISRDLFVKNLISPVDRTTGKVIPYYQNRVGYLRENPASSLSTLINNHFTSPSISELQASIIWGSSLIPTIKSAQYKISGTTNIDNQLSIWENDIDKNLIESDFPAWAKFVRYLLGKTLSTEQTTKMDSLLLNKDDSFCKTSLDKVRDNPHTNARLYTLINNYDSTLLAAPAPSAPPAGNNTGPTAGPSGGPPSGFGPGLGW